MSQFKCPVSGIWVLLSFLTGVVPLSGSLADSRHSCFNGQNPICQDIMTLKSSMGPSEALRLSHIFHRVSRRYNLNPRLLLAIGFQESTLTPDAVRKVRGISLDDKSNRPVTVGSDFCMMQINVVNIVGMKLDARRLLSDVEYCIESGAKILKGYEKRFGNLERTWWSRYNSCTPVYRQMYEKLVSVHWKKILPDGPLSCNEQPQDYPDL